MGDPGEAVAEIRKFERLGVEHLVFDFRFKFDRWFDQIELLGAEVLPKIPVTAATRSNPGPFR